MVHHPKAKVYNSVPGQTSTLLWATPAVPTVPNQGEAISAKTGYVPGPGETRFMFVTFPPDSVMMSPNFDFAAVGAEFMEHMPELASKFEMDNPGMHTTDTVDYGIVLDGEVWLELDDGKADPSAAARRCRTKRHASCLAQQDPEAGEDGIRADRRQSNARSVLTIMALFAQFGFENIRTPRLHGLTSE